MSFELSAGQKQSYRALVNFFVDPSKPTLVLTGYSGTGKSTLVSYFNNEYENIFRTRELATGKEQNPPELYFTATTHKAAEALSHFLGDDVYTIQSFLGLVVKKDYDTGETRLVIGRGPKEDLSNATIVIDEASYIDINLYRLIYEVIEPTTKVLFVGDPAQLLGMKAKYSPVFSSNLPTTSLTEVVRQAKDNPIIELATGFRNLVNTGEFFNFLPDNQHIHWVTRDEFEKRILAEFSRSDWSPEDSRILAWRNKTVVAYNEGIRQAVKGAPKLQPGDVASSNHYMVNSKFALKTDQLVKITAARASESLGFPGTEYTLNNEFIVFVPDLFSDRKAAIKKARDGEGHSTLKFIDGHWADLRAIFASTVNKAQGSTYRKVFVDLDDIGACRNNNQLARLLYVATSRASEQLILTGDIL